MLSDITIYVKARVPGGCEIELVAKFRCLVGILAHFLTTAQNIFFKVFISLHYLPLKRTFVLAISNSCIFLGYFYFISSSCSHVTSSVWWFRHSTLTKPTFLSHNVLTSQTRILIGFSS